MQSTDSILHVVFYIQLGVYNYQGTYIIKLEQKYNCCYNNHIATLLNKSVHIGKHMAPMIDPFLSPVFLLVVSIWVWVTSRFWIG